jgi:hypothetical protein
MPKNRIDDLRNHLFEQLERLKDENDPEKLAVELARAKAISDVSKVIIETAKVELDLVRTVGDCVPGSGFFIHPDERELPERPRTAITREDAFSQRRVRQIAG